MQLVLVRNDLCSASLLTGLEGGMAHLAWLRVAIFHAPLMGLVNVRPSPSALLWAPPPWTTKSTDMDTDKGITL